VNESTRFTVDVSGAGEGLLEVIVLDVDQNPVDVQTTRGADGKSYVCSFTPTRNTKHTISVVYGGVSVPGSPYRVCSYGKRTSNKNEKYSNIAISISHVYACFFGLFALIGGSSNG